MATIRFGARCDLCGVSHSNYSVEDIAWCEGCGRDLCDLCGEKTGHRILREWDVDQTRQRECREEAA